MKIKYFLFLFVVFSIFFFSYSRDFTEPDELKYVEISREMFEKANFLYPIYNYELYLDKGPFYFYILIFSQKVFGENKFSFIFAAQIFSLLIMIIFYKLLKLFKINEDEIILSILILISSIQYYFLSKAVRMDIVLSFFVIFSYYLLFLKLFKEKKGLEIFYGLSLTLALLTKGPVALIWFWAVPIIYGLFEKEKKVFKFIFHPITILLSLLPIFIWLFLLYNQLGIEPLKEIFLKQTTGRISSSFAHQRPIYYYFYSLPLLFFPFSFFLPFSLIRKDIYRESRFLFLWFLVPFIIFSLISGKLIIYLLPLYPAISYFISKFLLSEKYKLKIILSLLSIIFIIFGILLANFSSYQYEISKVFKSIKFLFLWFSLTFFLLFFKNKYFPKIFCIFSLIFNIFLSIISYPSTYSISLKNLSLKYSFLSKNQEFGYAFCDIKPSFLYYSHKKFVKLHKNEEVEKYLKEGKYIIIKEKNYNFLPVEARKNIKINYKKERLGEDFYIISIPNQKKSES